MVFQVLMVIISQNWIDNTEKTAWTLPNKFAKFEKDTSKGSEVTVPQSDKFVCWRAI